jgi:hypothetical protein
MAELIHKTANFTTEFGCYSERGLMSYFMFVVLPTQLGDFMADLQFPAGIPNPLANLKGTHPKAIIFSELDFGKRDGFGCPDGASFVEAHQPAMLFVETKLNESYRASCGGTSYNSTIRGQLELRWRMTQLHRTKCHQVYNGTPYIQETAEFKEIYEAEDKAFYGHDNRQDEAWPGSWRRLRIAEGVKEFLDLLTTCEDRVYFCAITDDKRNPFDTVEAKLLPRCGKADWSASKSHFCWLPVNRIVNATPSKIQEVAMHV